MPKTEERLVEEAEFISHLTDQEIKERLLELMTTGKEYIAELKSRGFTDEVPQTEEEMVCLLCRWQWKIPINIHIPIAKFTKGDRINMKSKEDQIDSSILSCEMYLKHIILGKDYLLQKEGEDIKRCNWLQCNIDQYLDYWDEYYELIKE